MINIIGTITEIDPDTGEVLSEVHNAIHYENMSIALANCLSSRGQGALFKMAFGNGAASVDQTGVITYLPPNVTGQNATLYNQTYAKIIDDTSVINPDPLRNKMTVIHTSGKPYTDILISCLLDYGEPVGQDAFDNGTKINSEFTWDEIGLLADYGTDSSGNPVTKLLSHAVFHPSKKALNKRRQIDYTIRIQSITNLVTI